MLHIIDDEEVIRDSLMWLAKSRGIPAVAYDSGKAFLATLDSISRTTPQGQCVLLDVRMPDVSGIALFDLLSSRSMTQLFPVIFLTGHGDVPMAVDTLKRGAFDFFEKPFNDNKLMDRVQEALSASEQASASVAIHTRLAALSGREREVLDLILEGKMNKVIADKLGISMRTVEVHRAHIFDKMNVKTAVELARLLK
ncbi:C4-dicarboxylate transport transcriptional regulatory protein DctR [Herminiimonas arsenicoxydans]|uniref:C4-dicarboxylate transport transcriptional regulatory protein DctR n=1 Tax=Herminiimonas arsenicoxydans TaxID=204773 RepID=A4G294_HERAR|nr:C4-dicarboxylate transport transcriptional regulatory protein DctR [Herminiimonas arsenicoxydans]